MYARRWTHLILWLVATFGVVASATPDAHAARIKDIAHVQGVRDNQLMGYGIVVGLDGTGDMGRAELTVQTISSMLSRYGIKIDKRMLRPRNVAAVIVTADLPPFAQSGQRIDVTVSSLGNARSLQGGTLLMTPLRGPRWQRLRARPGSALHRWLRRRWRRGQLPRQKPPQRRARPRWCAHRALRRRGLKPEARGPAAPVRARFYHRCGDGPGHLRCVRRHSTPARHAPCTSRGAG